MSSGSKTVKIFFPINMNEKWLGGVNYYDNLFRAISMVRDSSIEIYIPDGNPTLLYRYAKKNQIKKDIRYRLVKLIKYLQGIKFYKQQYLFKDINIASHTYNFDYSCPTISWIPDFQHIELPNMFSQNEIDARNCLFKQCAERSSFVILSSIDAKKTFDKLYPQYKDKVRVLNFVSYIEPSIYTTTNKMTEFVKKKYMLPKKYFYLPNQFWKHKNHITVFMAVKFLKDNGININVVCSGCTEDYRNKEHFSELLQYIKDNQLGDNIKILGIIDMVDVYCLMRNSVSVINPSLFEGWSSTVEEVKSLGKNIILSNLEVHKEQNPPQATYFECKNFVELAKIMKNKWDTMDSIPDYKLEYIAKSNMNDRMIKFGTDYIEIVKELKFM